MHLGSTSAEMPRTLMATLVHSTVRRFHRPRSIPGPASRPGSGGGLGEPVEPRRRATPLPTPGSPGTTRGGNRRRIRPFRHGYLGPHSGPDADLTRDLSSKGDKCAAPRAFVSFVCVLA